MGIYWVDSTIYSVLQPLAPGSHTKSHTNKMKNIMQAEINLYVKKRKGKTLIAFRKSSANL